MTAISNIVKGKVTLVTGHPFFGSLALRYPTDASEAVPTMGTDGRRIWYNEKWTEGLSREEVVGVLAHEVCHIALMFHVRIGNRIPELANIAHDYVVNLILRDSGFVLPVPHLYDEKYRDMAFEKVYDLLMDDVRTGKIKVIFVYGGSLGNGKTKIHQQEWGDVTPMPGSEDATVRSAEEAEIRIRVLQAAKLARARGQFPQAFEYLIQDYRASKVNWRDRLRFFVSGNRSDDWSYRRPNRKHMALSSVYLPTLECHGSGTIVIGVDSSGSVSDEEVAQFLGEIKAIHSEVQPDSTTVIWCDAVIHHVQTYTQWEEFDDKVRYGCGGTVLRPVFDYVAEHAIQPDCLIFLSDLEIGSDMDGLDPPYRVLWITTGQTKAPFGEVVKIEM